MTNTIHIEGIGEVEAKDIYTAESGKRFVSVEKVGKLLLSIYEQGYKDHQDIADAMNIKGDFDKILS